MNSSLDSRSEFLRVRGLRHHVRRWGDPSLPRLFITHGWLDVSATFQPLVEPLLQRWQVLMPDWRGFGYSEWPQDGYWFYDYVADLEAILDHYSPDEPVLLAGHSMGAQVSALYAGLRPQRVRKLACLDGIGLPDAPAARAPARVRKWLDQLREPLPVKTYESFEQLAGRVRRQHPRLNEAQALFVASCWGQQDGYGRIRLCADPKHTLAGPLLYRAAEAEEIWKQITAPTLFIDAALSETALPAEERARRRGSFADQRVVVIANAGHMLHFDAPRETAQALAAFMAD
ncbi:alpha/beta fold hydrolase [Nevskia soli]|uniref:alpha/beta fold hydrolase n=1 Tax=Nevskia soli TaxID=418856 RepID=UPI0004A76E3B|nr:alpha/beta hydrolase [Nevskia soli]